MPSLKKNIAANLVGRVWSAALTLLLIPVYIKFLGIESYGLIGFYTALLSALTILDLGLSTTLNRELARARAMNKDAGEVRNLVFSLELIYWGIGLFIGTAIALLAPLIAEHWVNVEQLPVSVVAKSVLLMGLVIAFQWPVGIYNGGLLGLEVQVLQNVLMIVMTTIRAAGILLVFMWQEPSLQLFFWWQAAISLLYVFMLRSALWMRLPKAAGQARFCRNELKKIWQFASGMTAVGLITFFLAQIDKIVLSKLLPLTDYGYYTLSFALASSLGTMITPVYTAFFPRFSALASTGDKSALSHIYHTGSKLVATIVFPVGLFVILFAHDILWVWTKNEATVQATSLMVQVLTAGNIFSCLMGMPTGVVQAQGNTRFLFLQNTVALAVVVPLLFVLTKSNGSLGATYVLLLMYAGCVAFSIPLINHRYFKGETWHWFTKNVFQPLLPPLAFLLLLKMGLQHYYPQATLNLFLLGCIAAAALAVSFIFHTASRQWLFHLMKLKKA